MKKLDKETTSRTTRELRQAQGLAVSRRAFTVIELLVKPGDRVALEQSLLTAGSDKASMEIPSSHAGVVKELRVKLGDKVAEGTLVLLLDAAGAAPAATSVAAPTPAPAPVQASIVSLPAAASAAPAVSGSLDVLVPDIGDFDEVAVIEVFVKAGDSVKVEQSLITVESDKASMEIPSSHAGVIKDVKVKVGDKVKQGSLIAVLQGAAGAAKVSAPAASGPAATPAAAPAPRTTRRRSGAAATGAGRRTKGRASCRRRPCGRHRDAGRDGGRPGVRRCGPRRSCRSRR